MTAYEELKALAATLSTETPHVHDFFDYTLEQTTSAQLRDILKIADTNDALCYLVCAYGCYALSHNLGRHSLIENPEKLFRSEQEQTEFIELFLKFARDELTQVKAVKDYKRTAQTT